MRLLLAMLLCPPTHRVVPYDPTPPMLRAAAKAMSPGQRPTEEWVPNSAKHRIRYQAMLEAAD